MEARNKFGRFNTIEDLAHRLPGRMVNKKTIECLAYSGALDEMGDRRTIAENYEVISDFTENLEKAKSSNQDQGDLFASFSEDAASELQQTLKMKPFPPLSVMEKLKKEKEYLGLFVSSTPLKGLSRYLKNKVKFIGDFTEKDLNKTHKLAGILVSIRTVITKSGTAMAYAELEDPTNKISLVIFPKIYEQFKFKIKEDQLFIVEGKLEWRRGELQFSVYGMKNISLETMLKNAADSGLYDPNEKPLKKAPNINPDKIFPREESWGGSGNAKTGPKYKHLLIEGGKLTITIPPRFKPQDFTKLKDLLSKLEGQLPVEIQMKEGTENKILKTQLKIDAHEDNLAVIEKFLG
jgi:DNA polymerase-3 subunit alpha